MRPTEKQKCVRRHASGVLKACLSSMSEGTVWWKLHLDPNLLALHALDVRNLLRLRQHRRQLREGRRAG